MLERTSIRVRMLAMAVCALLALGAFCAIQFLASEEVARATAAARALQVEIETITRMELANTEMVLAAMDSIIDKDEGDIQPERMEAITNALTILREGQHAVEDVANRTGHEELLPDFAPDIEAVGKAIQVDLADAIRTRAGEAAFARLDDVIDESGERVKETLATLGDAGTTALSAALDAVDAAVDRSLVNGLVTFLVAVAVLGPLMFLITRSITGALGRISGTMDLLVKGDFAVDVPYSSASNEIGHMARSVEVFRQNAEEAERLRQAQAESDRRAEADKRRAMAELAERFKGDVGAVVSGVIAASTELEKTAQQMATLSERVRDRSGSVASAAQQTAAGVEAVAAATEELSSSTNAIGGEVAKSTEVARSAVNDVGRANKQVQGLAEAARKIGDVVNMIHDIASQTNLLALNATIEAARAGEAGKGFAVVAHEVKSLATQTAKATDEISDHINRVQTETSDAVGAIEGIRNTIAQIHETAASIAAAVEQQVATTREISGNIQQVAGGSNLMTSNITEVSNDTRASNDVAANLLASVRGLSTDARNLDSRVNVFLSQILAA